MKRLMRTVIAVAALVLLFGIAIYFLMGGNSPAEKLMKEHPYTFETAKSIGTERQDSYALGEGCVYISYPKTKNKATDKAIEEYLDKAKDAFDELLEQRKDADRAETERVEIPRLVFDYTTEASGDYTLLNLSYKIEILDEQAAVSAPGDTPKLSATTFCIGEENEILDLNGILGENGEAKIRNMLKVKKIVFDDMTHFTVSGDTLTIHFIDSSEDFSIAAVKRANLIDPDKPMVALTFDDGPGGYSKELADLFEQYNGRATFFVLGQLVPTYSDSLKYVYEKGNEIGSHTYNHKNLNIQSEATVRKEIEDTKQVIFDAIGAYPTVIRTPYGNANSTVMKIIDGPNILWSVDTLDWQSRDSSKIVNKILNETSDGDIVLMHEIYGFTYNAVKTAIKTLADRGYQFVTVSELMQYKGVEPEGKIYSADWQVK